MVGGDVVLEIAEPGAELASERVVDPVRERRDRHERCVVPPQRRLISIAKFSQPAAWTETKSTAQRPITPSRASRRPTVSAWAAICGAYSGSAGNGSRRGLPVRAAQHLIVRREDVDLARGADPQLRARAAQVVALDQLLDDAALVGERGEVRVDRRLGVLELHRAGEGSVVECPAHVDERVPEAADPAVELTIAWPPSNSRSARRTSRSPPTSKPRACRTSSSGRRAGPIFVPSRASFGSARRVDPEPHGELDLVARREGEEEGELRRHSACGSARSRPAGEQFRQRLVAAVDERDDREAAARLRRVQLRDEAEVVVDQPRQDRLRGHVDDA